MLRKEGALTKKGRIKIGEQICVLEETNNILKKDLKNWKKK